MAEKCGNCKATGKLKDGQPCPKCMGTGLIGPAAPVLDEPVTPEPAVPSGGVVREGEGDLAKLPPAKKSKKRGRRKFARTVEKDKE